MSRTYVCRDWEPRNAYTTPIREKPYYRNSGIIKAVAEDGEKIQVGKITYEAFENEEFQYIISPFWEIVDMLPSSVFQGIPGIDMDLRLEHYYRVNYTPVFMTERTPGPNREDLWELLDSVNLTYYDRLEWLIRTDLRAAVDNLIVERAREKPCVEKAADREAFRKLVEEGQYGDEIQIEKLQLLGKNSEECTKNAEPSDALRNPPVLQGRGTALIRGGLQSFSACVFGNVRHGPGQKEAAAETGN